MTPIAQKNQDRPITVESQIPAIPSKEMLELMPADLIEEFRAFIFEKNGDEIKIAAVNPDDKRLRQFAKTRLGNNIKWFKANESELNFILQNATRDFKAEISYLTGAGIENNGNIVKLINRIIHFAIVEKASDIHIEPLRHETAVRFRIDGILHTIASLPKESHPAVIARLKILANLKIDEYRRPQDGRIEPEELPSVSLRVSTIPTLYGEKIAIRILDDTQKSFSVENLGFSPAFAEILKKNAEKPFGMIVTSGPTGSGKTTTLYALLNLLKTDGINISTLEDPIEYAQTGVNQIQINPRVDLTFASGLKSLLRQDPDVIMVGEIRDSETAVMASNAALTGHLVLTTIHTNDAPSAFTRFLEMKVDDFVAASVINLVIAQRLVRKICGNCKTEEKLESHIVNKISERKDVLSNLSSNGISISDISKKKFFIGKGCDKCLHTGYSGRIGIFEILELNREIHDLILEHADSEKIKDMAVKSGFKDIIYDGIRKVLAGVTTFDEVLRTTRNT